MSALIPVIEDNITYRDASLKYNIVPDIKSLAENAGGFIFGFVRVFAILMRIMLNSCKNRRWSNDQIIACEV